MAKTKVKPTNGKNLIADIIPKANGHAKAEKPASLKITAPKMRRIKLRIIGTAPYMQLRFSQKAMNTMIANMEAGSQAKSKRTRSARDFNDDYEQAFHRLPDGSP